MTIKRDEDMEPREPGCECQWEEGDSPCIVHGLYEADLFHELCDSGILQLAGAVVLI